MATAGFEDRGFPDGRVLRICSRTPEVTISQIGRELGITRQGAGKVVAKIRDGGYVTIIDSTTSGREKVTLTPRASAYLAAQRNGDDQPRLRDFLRMAARLGDVVYPEDEPAGPPS
jgi:DNA-binding MarR family transcriptional regulator